MKSSKRASGEATPPPMSSGSNKSFKMFGWLRRDKGQNPAASRCARHPSDKVSVRVQRLRKQVAKPIETPRRFNGGDVMLELIDQAAKAVQDAEARANETERYTRNIAETAVKTLQRAVKRIQELEAELESSRAKPLSQARTNTPEEIVHPGRMTFVAYAREKAAAMTAYLRPRRKADATIPSIWDQGLSNVGWTEILARADAALNEASARVLNRPHHKIHLVSEQAA
jgi:uncharacterized protein with GYD domain